MKTILFALTLPFYLSYAFQAQASCALINKEEQEQIIKDSKFIGIVGITKLVKYNSGVVKQAKLLPKFVYKSSDGFDLTKEITINYTEDVFTSCDYTPRGLGHIQEVVITQDNNGNYHMGNKFQMTLGRHWKNLRKQVKYIF